jgi:hypothetical protein
VSGVIFCTSSMKFGGGLLGFCVSDFKMSFSTSVDMFSNPSNLLEVGMGQFNQ